MEDATETVIEDDLQAGGETPPEDGSDAAAGATDEALDGAAPADGGEGAADAATDADAAELVVSIGEEPQAETDDEKAPSWVKDLRKQNRELVRALRQKDAELGKLKTAAAPATAILGPKPTLEGCDFDAEKFEAELEGWHAKKREADDAQRQRQQAEEQSRTRWQGRLDDVTKAGAALKVRDAEEAAEVFDSTFSVLQQSVIVDGPEDPKDAALLRYALGKNPGVAKKLATIENPVRFAFAVARVLNKDLTVKPRTAPPPPDRVVRSGVAGAAAGDVKLAELHRKAQETGNYQEYFAYKRDKARKAA